MYLTSVMLPLIILFQPLHAIYEAEDLVIYL